MNTTQEKAALQIVQAIYSALVSVGEQGLPAGHLYAMLMEQGCTLEQYQSLESLMVKVGMISKNHDLLTANLPGTKGAK